MSFCARFCVLFLDPKQIYYFSCNFMLSNPIIERKYMGNAEIWNFSTTLELDISQVNAVIFHILQAM